MKIKSLILVIFLISCNTKPVESAKEIVYANSLDNVSNYNNIVSNYNNITEKMNLIINDYYNICGLDEQIKFNEQANIELCISYDEFNKFVQDINFQGENLGTIKTLEESLKDLVLTLKPLYLEYEKTILHYKDKREDAPPIEYLHKSFLKKYNQFKSSYNKLGDLLLDDYKKTQDEYMLEQSNMTITLCMSNILKDVDINSINKLKNFSDDYIQKYFIDDEQIKYFNEFREKAYLLKTELKDKNLDSVNAKRDELVVLYNKIIK